MISASSAEQMAQEFVEEAMDGGSFEVRAGFLFTLPVITLTRKFPRNSAISFAEIDVLAEELMSMLPTERKVVGWWSMAVNADYRNDAIKRGIYILSRTGVPAEVFEAIRRRAPTA